MVKFLPFIIAFAIVTLFSISLLNTSILMAEYNNPSRSIGNDPNVREYSEAINETVGDFSNEAGSSEDKLGDSPTTKTDTNLITDAMVGIWKIISTTPKTMYNLTVGFIGETIGFQGFVIVVGILGGIIAMALVIAVFRMLFTGDGG